MKKIILIISLLFLLLLAAAGAYIWYMMQKPLYEPGMVRTGQNLGAPLTSPSQPPAEDTWLVEPDIRLHHFAAGQGANVLVIHGGPGSPFSAPLPALQPLTDHYRFLYYDQRGCGASTRPIDRFDSPNTYQNMLALDQTLGLGAQIADIERIRQIIGDDKLIIIGHSFGGFLASLYAAEFPEHVRALILVAPAEMLVMPSESGGLFETVKPLLSPEMQPDYEAYLKRYFDFGGLFGYSDAELAALNAEFIPYYTAAAAAKGFAVPEGQPGSGGGWMVWGMYLSMGQRHDYRQSLGAVSAPTLVIHGSLDLQTEQASRQYIAALPNAEFQLIDNAGHFPFNDQPAAFAQLVGDFLASLP